MIDIKVEEEEERRAAKERREEPSVTLEEEVEILKVQIKEMKEVMGGDYGWTRRVNEAREICEGEDAREEVKVLKRKLEEAEKAAREVEELRKELEEKEGTIKLLRTFNNYNLISVAREYCADEQAAVIKYGPITGWDVSEVMSMNCLFCADSDGVGEAGKQFNAHLCRWDVSNVTDMLYMFYGAEQFNCDLSSWNVEKVTDMHHMFREAKKFDKNTIKGWKLEGKNTYGMFGNSVDVELGDGTRKL
ncbi:hypothetical protein TrST_g2722 [Triparma strigata]|uniref:BspA family leucine-rich repeat surface protein n=1 Tax=Triparma strigata TaxID=1606541 RepID=A0A9W7BXC9_9STRA|nr:hypothetical protein TrST_g2722 [Triparma strigata]